jgi:uncharacterized membrane protein SirB2
VALLSLNLAKGRFILMYMALKHSHMLFATLSILLLIIRFGLSFTSSTLLQSKFLKIVPHIVDTLLLLSAVWLMFTLSQYPLQTPWLTEKVIGVAAYISLGFMALKGRTAALRVMAFLGALGWLGLVIRVAVTKTPVLFG